MPRYDIVMLSSGQVALTRACITSVIRNSYDYRLIWIDNGSYWGKPFPTLTEALLECANDGAARSISAIVAESWGVHPDKCPILYYQMPGNLGFTKGANVGLSISTADYVVLLNDDTEVPPGWLEALEAGFREIPKLAAIGTLSTSPRQWQWENSDLWRCRPQGERGRAVIVKPRLTLSHAAIGGPLLAFFCTMFSRESLEAIGLLDERFSPGFAEDDDWCARAHLAGWNLAVHTDVLVKHAHHASWSDERRAELQARNARLIREKYADLIPAT